METIQDHKVSRCVTVDDYDDKTKNCLVCFCDASTKAYAAVIYLVQTSEMNRKSQLIFSKSRLAPIKCLTIPRLEFMAVLIGVRCIRFVRTQLRLPMVECHLFTDTQCVLKGLVSKKQLPLFINNRVNEIKSEENLAYHYIKSENNPTDLASRGCDMKKLYVDQQWWHRPD